MRLGPFLGCGFGEGAGFNGLVRGALVDGGKRGSSFLGLLGLLALAMAGGLGTAVHLWDRIEVLTWGECQEYSRGVRLYANLMGKVEAIYSIGVTGSFGGYWVSPVRYCKA